MDGTDQGQIRKRVDALLGERLELAQQEFVEELWRIGDEFEAKGMLGGSAFNHAVLRRGEGEIRKRASLIENAWREVLSAFREAVVHIDSGFLSACAEEKLRESATQVGAIARSIEKNENSILFVRLEEQLTRSVGSLGASLEIMLAELRLSSGVSYDVFISYRGSDRPTAEMIARYLRDREFRVWFDLWELTPGKPWSEELEKALLQSRSIVVVVGPRGIGTWQSAEYEAALTQVVGSRDRLVIPVIAPKASTANVPLFLQQYNALILGEDDEATLDRLAVGLKRYRAPLPTEQATPPKVFLCHAKEDGGRIEKLYFDLRDRGLDPWYDKENLVVGDHWELEIMRAIEGSDFFAIFLSETSCKKTGFIQKEIRTAVR